MMTNKNRLKFFLYADIAILMMLLMYVAYLHFFESDFDILNVRNIEKINEIKSEKRNIAFAVVGNIKNSIGVFDKKIIDKLNRDDIDFVISMGNAVTDGSEDKYRLINRSINKLHHPFVSCIGEGEVSNGGSQRFYKHFGPFYFSFYIGNAYFLFLDTTGKTAIKLQKKWLVEELGAAGKYKYRFVFMNKPPYEVESIYPVVFKEKYIRDESFRNYLIGLYSKHKVTAVYSSNFEVFDERVIAGVKYVVSGGAGGLAFDNEKSFYHYINVQLGEESVNSGVVRIDYASHGPISRKIENFWLFLHSIFYISFVNFAIIVGILVLLGIILYNKVSKNVNYYRDFNEASDEYGILKNLKIAMFTNNYFPFVGGVPISIERLAKGLERLGYTVYIFAPKFKNNPNDDIKEDGEHVLRYKPFGYYKRFHNIPVTNIFSPEIKKQFDSFNIDVVHVHHPFWMGKKGLQLGKKSNIPVVLTYHTRLEEYAHYVPVSKKIFRNIIAHNVIKRFAKECDAIIAPTNDAKEYLMRSGTKKDIEVIPTGIDLDLYNSVNEEVLDELAEKYDKDNNIILLTVSRLSVEKNIMFLLESVKQISDNCDIKFKFLVVGDGSEKNSILDFISQYNLSDIFYLIGQVSPEDICKYYIFADIFVFASKSETQGMVVMEAMAGRCPVVAVRSSGINDIIEEGFNGYKTKEDINEWTEKVINLMKNKNILNQISDNAYKYALRNSSENMAISVANLYAKLITEKGEK